MRSNEDHGEVDAIQLPASHPSPLKVGEEEKSETEERLRGTEIEPDKARRAREHLRDGTIDLAKFCSETKIQTATGALIPLQVLRTADGVLEISYQAPWVKPIKIPAYIPLDKKTLRFFGLLQAETTRVPGYGYLDFHNVNFDNIRFVLQFLRQVWKIDLPLIRFDVMYHRPCNDETAKMVVQTVAEKLGVPKEMIRFYEAARKRPGAAELGVINVSVGSRAFREVNMRILEVIVKPLAECDYEVARWYFTGVMAGDGVPVTPEGTKRRGIQISLSYDRNTDEAEHYLRVLRTLQVEPTPRAVQKNDILIQGWQNLLALAKATEGEIALPDTSKTTKFCRAFLKHRFLADFEKHLRVTGDGQPTTKQIMEALKIGRPTTVRMLGRLRDLELVTRTEAGHGRDLEHQYRYTLTERGRDILQTRDQIRKKLEELELEHQAPQAPFSQPEEDAPR